MVKVGSRELTLTNLNKVLWPEDGFTKADLIQYLTTIAPVLLKHLHNRPLVFTRYPDGIHGEWFYQKDTPEYAPEWLSTFRYETADPRSEKRVIEFVLANGVEDLAWIANQASIEIHPWLSSLGTIDYPDYAVFDLDPAPPATFEDAVVVARALEVCLEQLGLRGYPKTSGATGLHIYLPVRPVYAYDAIAEFVRQVAEIVKSTMPGRVTLARPVKERTGKVYIDYLQNIKGKTIVGPYIPRPLRGAPVSTPFSWNELDGIDPARFTIQTVPARISSSGDLFDAVLRDRQSLDVAMGSLGVATGAGGRRPAPSRAPGPQSPARQSQWRV
ncbi:MAG: DNA polymerase domain-containing protein [Firmicutes bacterium]|nr:DNA polymerase domain-containing protein [Bacillota bacterium]